MVVRFISGAVIAAAAFAAAPKEKDAVKFETIAVESREQPAKPEARVRKDGANTVVVVFAGEKPTGGYAVRITGVKKNGAACVVSHEVKAPGPRTMVTQAITYPFEAVRIRARCETVTFDPPLPVGQARE